MSRALSLAALLFFLAGLVTVGHLISRNEAETERESSTPVKEADEPRRGPLDRSGDVAQREVGRVRTSPRRHELSAESSKLPPSSDRSSRSGNTRAETRATTSSRVPNLADDHGARTPLIDPTLRRRLEDVGVDPSTIDYMERRLRSEALEAGDAPQTPPMAPEQAPDAEEVEPGDGGGEPEFDGDRLPIGVTLYRIRADMPAGMAGLIDGDKLLTYDGWDISNITDLRYAIYNAPPDTRVIAAALRDDMLFEVWLEPGVLGAELVQNSANR